MVEEVKRGAGGVLSSQREESRCCSYDFTLQMLYESCFEEKSAYWLSLEVLYPVEEEGLPVIDSS